VIKKFKLVVRNTSWWKNKKIRRESAIELLKKRDLGWKLKKSLVLKNSSSCISTNTIKTYILYK
tara:strand:- start:3932 stop:4123 length:192 start_codon:yes stop_codon:yes gene_type:complete